MKQEKFETYCADGVKLSGLLLIPEKPKAVIQFNCGTATKKAFYLKFLTYLTENGYLCCLWNYRWTNESDNLKNRDLSYIDYGIKDMPGIKSYLDKRFPHLPFMLIGHSVGGQQIGFMNNLDNVVGNINIAVSSGYWLYMPFKYRMRAYFFFYVFSPLSALVYGYIKAKPYGFMENLPTKFVLEWRKWLGQKDLFLSEKYYGNSIPKGHFKNFKFPIHVYYSTDDAISSAKNTKAFWRNVKSEKGITFTELTPTEFGLNKIDHFGYFKKNMKDTLWADIVNKLNNFLVTFYNNVKLS